MTNQYQQVGNGISHLGQVAQQIALGLAQQRYQQAQQQQMMQLRLREQAMQEQVAQQRGRLMGQQGQQAESMTGFNNARAGQIANTEKAKGDAGYAAWLMNMTQAEKSLPAPQGMEDKSLPLREMFARGRMMDSMSRLPDAARSELPINIAQMMQMGDPRAQQMMATGTRMNASVSPGATLYDLMNQQPLFSSPRTLGEGQVLRPNVEGSQGLPKTFSPQNNNNLFGSLVNLLGQGRVSGVTVDPNNPINQQTEQAIQALLPQLMQNITNGAPAKPQMGLQSPTPQLQPAPTHIVQPKSQEEFNALPSGTIYINPADGKQYRKN